MDSESAPMDPEFLKSIGESLLKRPGGKNATSAGSAETCATVTPHGLEGTEGTDASANQREKRPYSADSTSSGAQTRRTLSRETDLDGRGSSAGKGAASP